MTMNTSRQAALPTPAPTVNVAQGGMNIPMSGRVTFVHEGEDHGHVDVFLDNGAVLSKVPVMIRQSGPDRSDDDIPRKRSLVVIQFLWGNRDRPYVAGVLPRKTKTKKAPAKAKAYRRVWASGMHILIEDDGHFELRTADGTALIISSATAAIEDHTGKPKESDVGNPMKDEKDVPHSKPGAYNVTLKMASGVTFSFNGTDWTVTGLGSAHFKAASSIKLQVGLSGIAIGPASIQLVAPALQWFMTPATAATFPPAGMVTLIPLPSPSPFGFIP